MRATAKRTLAILLAVSFLVTCAISGLVLPALADDPVLYFEKGIVTVPAIFGNEYDILSQLKAAEGYTIDEANLQWSIADNKVKRYYLNASPYAGTAFEAITLTGSIVKTEAATTAASMSALNKAGNWSFAHAQPTITVTDGVNTATAKIRWVYDTVPVYYDFENGQTMSHSTSHKLNSYITQELEGNTAVRFPTNDSIPTRAFMYPAFAPNSVYKISYEYKNEGTGTGTRMFTLNDQYDITMSPSQLTTNATTSGWQTVEATMTTGAAPTVNYHYAFFFARSSASTNYVWMDNFKIELISSPATDIVVKPESPKMHKGAAKTFTIVSEPAGASAGSVTWSVSDSTKASIDPVTGVMTALADSGTVQVIATSSYGLTDSTTVTLLPEKVVDPNVVFESDFEDGHNSIPSYMSAIAPKDDTVVTIQEDDGDISNHLLQIEPMTAGRYFVFSDNELIPGRTYKLSFKAKGGTLSTYVTGGQATPAGFKDYTPDQADKWQTFEQYLTIPYTLIHGSPKYIIALRNRDTEPCYIDDMEFRLVDADPPAESIEFDYTRLNMKPGRTREIKLLVNPEVCDLSGIAWKSSNEQVAYVVAGKVTAVGAGTATITATTNNGKVATAYVTVTGHNAFIADGTFEAAANGWTLTGTAAAEAGKGYYYTTSMTLPVGSTASYTLSGVKANTPYQLFVHQALPNNTAVTKVTVTNGGSTVYEGMLGKTQAWTPYVLEFTTGAIAGNCTITFENTATADRNIVYLDNVILAEVVSDEDPNQLIFGDFEDTLSATWSEYVKNDGKYVTVIKDPDDPTNHVMEFKPFYNQAGTEVSGYWFQGLQDKLIPGRTYKATFRIKGIDSGLDLYCWPGIFAKPATYDSIGWIHPKAADDGTWTQFEYTWTVDPQAIHMTSYIFALKNQNDAVVYLDDLEVRLLPEEAPATELEFNYPTLSVAPGRTASLRLSATPETADLSGLTWTSSNEQVAFVIPGQVSVTGAGKQAQITAVGGGTTVITATAKSGAKATCTVTVNADAALVKDITFNNTAASDWTLVDGAAKVNGKGHYYTTALNLPKDASVKQTITGLKANSRYQLFVTSSSQSSGSKNNTRVKLLAADGVTEILNEPLSTATAWTVNKFEFSIGEAVDSSYTLLLVNETADGAYAVNVDNVFVAEALSDADLIVSDFYWDNDPGYIAQVKPGTPLTFTVSVVNQGTEAVRANQSFDIDILLDAKTVINTISHAGAIEPGALITVTGTVPWEAVEGDHMLTAHVNKNLKLLENNIDNNDMTYNLRVYDEALKAPAHGLKHGFSKLTFSDDFNSVDTIDTKATGDEGYHWYVTRQYGESDQQIGRDFTVKDGVLTIHSIESAWAHSISTTDTRKTSGFIYNKGLLEARVRLPYTSKDQDRLDHEVRNPGIWAFDAQTMWAEATGEYNTVGIETDWIEFKGTKYKNPKTGEKECSFHTVLHHREDTNGDDVQDYWTSTGEEFYYTDGYVISGATADDMGEWHTLSWAWATDIVEMYIDGKLINVFTYSEDGYSQPGSNSKYAGVPVKEGDFSPLNTQYNNIILGAQDEFRMEVDYIRVWQYDGSVEPEETKPTVNAGPANKFITQYLRGEDGKVYTEVTADNYEQILSGEAAYSLLEYEQQEIVDSAIGTAYFNWLADIYTAKGIVDNFVSFYASAEDGTPYTAIDVTNADWIAGAAAEWDSLTDLQRAMINKQVTERSGMSFEEMLEQAIAFKAEVDKDVNPAGKGGSINWTWLWIVLGVVGVVIVAGGVVIAILLFSKKRKKA